MIIFDRLERVSADNFSVNVVFRWEKQLLLFSVWGPKRPCYSTSTLLPNVYISWVYASEHFQWSVLRRKFLQTFSLWCCFREESMAAFQKKVGTWNRCCLFFDIGSLIEFLYAEISAVLHERFINQSMADLAFRKKCCLYILRNTQEFNFKGKFWRCVWYIVRPVCRANCTLSVRLFPCDLFTQKNFSSKVCFVLSQSPLLYVVWPILSKNFLSADLNFENFCSSKVNSL